MIKIERIVYSNEAGEMVTIDFGGTEPEYRIDRVNELVREMASGGRDLGPPPRPGTGGGRSAWDFITNHGRI